MTTEHPAITRFRDEHRARGGTGEIVILPDSVHTAALAAEALGCEVGAIANSLLFDAAGSPVLILTSGAHRVDTALTAERLGLPALKRAKPDFVREHTGQVIGGVSPLGAPGTGPDVPRLLAAEVRRGLGRRRSSRGGVLHVVRRAPRAHRRDRGRGRVSRERPRSTG